MTSTTVAYAAGRHAWLDGEPMPRLPPDDASEAEQLYWLGYMRERIRDYIARRTITLDPDRVEPRP